MSPVSSALNLLFPHSWQAEILAARPLILPSRRFTYPQEVEEVERGALEVLVRSEGDAEPFLATCALGFRDPTVPTGVWSMPRAEELCAVAGGYAYILSTTAPQRFTFLHYRPVLSVFPFPSCGVILFIGFRSILAWGGDGQAWESAKLSDEGLSISSVEGNTLHGLGWNRRSDKEEPFTIDLVTGNTAQASGSRQA